MFHSFSVSIKLHKKSRKLYHAAHDNFPASLSNIRLEYSKVTGLLELKEQ